MIGYMKPVKKTFSKEDRNIYQAIYCGLCRCLKYEYGFTGMAILEYEIVDMLLLIGAMAPEPFPLMNMSCSLTPVLWRKMAGTNEDAFHAAAGVTICAAALESMDNLRDSDKWYERLISKLIDPKARRMMTMFRPEFLELQALYDRFMEIEDRAKAGDPTATFEMLTEASGAIIAKAAAIIGVYANCGQLKELQEIMDLWGRWIYVIDAADDYKGDLREGAFNPLFLPDRPASVAEYLKDLEDRANAVLDRTLIRNYESAIDSLFRQQLPRRREIVLEKCNITKIEGDHRESSIQSENRSDPGDRPGAAEPAAAVCPEPAAGLRDPELL